MLPLKALLLGLWFAALAGAERLAPASPRPAGEGRVFRNLALWATNTAMNPVLTVPISAAAAGFVVWTRPEMPSWAALALDLLLLDLWTYAWHRANHECRFLWRFHRVHHWDEFLDTTSAVRFHPGEVLISALARAPLIVLADIDLVSILLFDSLMLGAALFHHSNVRLPPKLEAALRVVIATPSHHWVHHHALRADTDSNYGALLTVWDRLFGSWSKTARWQVMPIGVEGEHDAPLVTLALSPLQQWAH
jgi:sterol desaturase/sphingolipid hydroxylase (fatty acid hydroxylase superfamily)